jgi:uncharacterized protein YndB with AHSA1/START domain
MPDFTLTGEATAPVEEVWKLLFDPSRFPEWWVGVETVRVGATGEYTMWHVGNPDFPMPQRLRADRVEGRVTVSCQVSEIDFSWQLGEHGDGTRITARVVLPPAMAGVLDEQREAIARSLANLAELADADAGGSLRHGRMT